MTSIEYLKYLISDPHLIKTCLLFILLFISADVLSQEQEIERDTLYLDDSTLEELGDGATLFEQKSELDPQTASIYSAVLPGMGQIYNNHHWKVPIIYAGGLAFVQIVRKNNQLYRAFRNALFNEIDLDPTTESPFPTRFYSTDALRRNTDSFRRNRDFFIIMGILWYGLQIVDAHVSAHLDEFNVNDELSFQISPTFLTVPTAPVVAGFVIRIKFHS